MKRMILCMSLSSQYGPALTEQLTMLKKAGFDGFFTRWERGVDLSPLAEAARREGMLFQSIHAPHLLAADMWERTEKTQDAVQELLDCLELCHRLQVPIMVAHTIIGFDKHTPTVFGLENFDRVVARARALQVKIALENTEGEEYLAALMERYRDDPYVGFCWDTGHENCYNYGKDMLALHGDRLIATHLNDNLGVCDPAGGITWKDDLHLLPFDGKCDWQGIVARMKRHGFRGPLTFELVRQSKPGRHENDAYEKMPLEDYFAQAFERACRVAAMMEE